MYDNEGCMLLLAAIVRRWWMDAIKVNPALIPGLADFLEIAPAEVLKKVPDHYSRRWLR